MFRLYYPYNLYFMREMRRQADSEVMLKARHYYSSNQKRIDDICGWLSDEKSVDTYKKLIAMRQYYRAEDIPLYNYFDQYFPKDLPEFSEKWNGGEVIIDCGAFNGDTSEKIANKVKKYDMIYAFEPDKNNIIQLKKRCKRINNLEIICAACSDRDGMLAFVELDSSGGSHIDNEKNEYANEVECKCIDTVIGDGRCDFIKMDIEGAEWDALHGAKNTIIRNRPRLAISIYHSDEDMIRLIEYIHELIPEYKLYVRAHTMGIAESILYAYV